MAVQIAHVNKTIGKQQVLRDVSLTIHEGEIVGLLGPNGAGKSTLMKILIGIWEADKPRHRLGIRQGKKINNAPKENGIGEVPEQGENVAVDVQKNEGSTVVEVPEKVGYLPERNPLYEEMYVAEYLQFMGVLTEPKTERKAIAIEVERLIEQVGLTPERYKRIGQLSKGYRQRVGLAQALLGNPQLLILDEPTTGLDPNQLVEIRSLIRSLGQNKTIILSTHILQEVREMCDRVVILDHGQIKADMPMAQVESIERLFHEKTME